MFKEVDFKCYHHITYTLRHTQTQSCEGVEMLTNLIVVIVLQNNMYLVITLCTLNLHMLYVNNDSIKLGKILKLKTN